MKLSTCKNNNRCTNVLIKHTEIDGARLFPIKLIASLILITMVSLAGCQKEITTDEPLIGDSGSTTPVPGALFGDTTIIDGYFERMSVYNINDSLQVYINAKRVTKNVKLKIFDGAGTFRTYLYIDSIIPQRITTLNPSTDGYGYKYKVTFKLNLPSGYYTIGKKIPFIIKNRAGTGDVVILYPQNTVNAYNSAGGLSLYTTPKATTVSFHRPTPAVDQFMGGFLKQNPIPNADWITDKDLEDYNSIRNYKVLVIVGHSEYWTRQARLNYDKFIGQRKRVLILSGNTMWWQVRYSADKSKMICYKLSPDPITQTDPLLTSTNWNLPIVNYPIVPSIGGEFTYAGYGVKVGLDSGWDGYKILKPNSPLLAGLNLTKGQILSCPGKEWDGPPSSLVNGEPVIDKSKWNPYKVEIVAYDMVTRSGSQNMKTIGTLLVFKKSPLSGTVINVCNTNWCAANGLTGINGPELLRITLNAVNGLVNDLNMFSVN